MADEPEPPHAKFKLRTEEKFERANEKPGQEDPNTTNDVRNWRADQRSIEHQAGVDVLAPVENLPGRRRREFWILMLVGNAFFDSAVYFGQSNPLMLACGTAGVAMWSLGLYWVMFHIMTKY